MQPLRPNSEEDEQFCPSGCTQPESQRGSNTWSPTRDEVGAEDSEHLLQSNLASRKCSGVGDDEVNCQQNHQNDETTDHSRKDDFELLKEAGLPPKPLTPLRSRQIYLLLFEFLIVGAAIVGVSKSVQVIVGGSTFLNVPDISQDCGGYSVPSVERIFYINLQLARNLSFSQAKLLDLAWDTFVGQGGRFLHGWVLYHVLASALGWMMEYSAVPYDFQITTLFSTVSLESLWASALLASKKQPRRMTFFSVWFSLAILYALLFPSLWGAATGYLQPSSVAYRMPGSSYATEDSDALNLCWAPDDSRLDGVLPDVVLGPRFNSCYSSLSTLDYLRPVSCSFINDTSDEWKALYTCKSNPCPTLVGPPTLVSDQQSLSLFSSRRLAQSASKAVLEVCHVIPTSSST